MLAKRGDTCNLEAKQGFQVREQPDLQSENNVSTKPLLNPFLLFLIARDFPAV